MIKEYRKCLEDPIYFIENYCVVNNSYIKLNDYQKARIKEYYEKKN